ncbi:MAG: DapH/DapD/GlmU-related protein [Roseiflexaceae bacterium]|nr:DapH/DapD/GlmU-related protein [Roseiflexaceae bacterium]
MHHIFRALYSEVSAVHPRLLLAQLLTAPLPLFVGSRLRTRIIRLIGFQIGRGVLFAGMPRIFGVGNLGKRLIIGQGCFFNVGVTLDLGAPITIGNNVSIGPDAMILTTTHDFGPADHRCGTFRLAPVSIGNGVWIGARAVLLPGIVIGNGAVIAAGALVNRDVAAHQVVAGVPARAIKSLDHPIEHNNLIHR